MQKIANKTPKKSTLKAKRLYLYLFRIEWGLFLVVNMHKSADEINNICLTNWNMHAHTYVSFSMM